MGLDIRIPEGADRFTKYLEQLTSVIGHADRRTPLHDYCLGLLAADGRKSVEPMASVTAPASVSAQHQKLLHFVANSPWSDARVLAKVREIVVPEIERHGPIKVWIIDDTGFPKQGEHSVGVKHQYCGQLGKQANCQVAVTLSIANDHASLPIAYRLYLPKEWAEDAERRKKARVPEEIEFKTKPQIALDQLRAACAAGVPRGVVLKDSSYGSNSALRAGVSELGLCYVVGIIPTIKVQAVLRRGKLGKRMSVKRLARRLPKNAWQTITWREGTNNVLRSRFARVQVHTAPIRRAAERPEETLLIEWPEGAAEPTKYWLSTVDKNIFMPWSIWPKCAGGSSAITRSSSRKSGLAITRDVAGRASTITPRYASRSTDSWSPKGRRFPPQNLVAPLDSKCLPYPVVTDPEAPPLRPQRHVPNSIATLHRRAVYAIGQALLPRCPAKFAQKYMTQ